MERAASTSSAQHDEPRPQRSEIRDRNAHVDGATDALEANDLIAGYLPGVNILNGCSLNAQVRASSSGIIGPNGAGKSTLLKAIFGLVQGARGPSPAQRRGHHRTQGEPARRKGVGFVPQTNNVFPR